MKNSVRVALIVVIGTVGAAAPSAQGPATERRFDVASVKPSLSPAEAGAAAGRAAATGQPAPSPIFGIRTQPGGRFLAGASLKQFIAHAYDVKDYQIDGGPKWLASDYFEITANAGADATPADIRSMLRSLLAERFALRLHRETREAQTHVLTLARPDGRLGPRLTRTTPECLKQIEAQKNGGTLPASPAPPNLRSGFPTTPTCGRTMMMSRSNGASALLAGGTELATLISHLSDELSAPVIDQTGLSGVFDISMEYLSERFAGRPTGLDPNNNADTPPPTLVPALQQQLGLRLEKKVAPMPVIVIDAAERPTPN